jgi:hypothetical protein
MPATAAVRSTFSGKAFRRAALALLLAAGVAGCRLSGDSDFSRNGIGADLYSGDIAQATENLETYFGFICKQANVPTTVAAGENEYPVCTYAAFTRQDWTIVVQTGFNDIDRRCDAYLAWLENVRLRGSYVNAQLNDTGRLTNAILTSLAPSAGVAIGIVGEAFGFARSSFNNYQNRALLGFEGSTIKTIVSERRLAFRDEFSHVLFRFKPDAVNALRSYLRICMPYTITMDANTYARSISSGMGLPRSFDPAAERDAIVGENALSARTSESVARPNPTNSQLSIAQEEPNVVKLFGTGSGKTAASVRAVQTRLCAASDGIVSSETVLAVTNWRRALVSQMVEGDDRLPLTPGEERNILTLPLCDATKFTNYYETTVLATPQQVASFVTLFNRVGGQFVTLPENPTISRDKTSDLRTRIVEMRRFLATNKNWTENLPSGFEHYLTFALRNRLVLLSTGGG